MKLKYVLIAGLLSGLSLICGAQAQDGAPEGHIINLSDVDIMILIEDVGTITGNSFVVHPDVRANVNVTSPTPLSDREVFELFLATLRVHGFSAVPEGRNIYRIVPEELASFEANGQGVGSSVFFTEVFRLDHFSAVEAAKLIQPLLGPQGKVNASNTSNAVIVVERGQNLEQIRRLIIQIDEDQSETRTVALKTIPVIQMQEILDEAMGANDTTGARGTTPFSTVPASASNTLIMRGAPDVLDQASALIRQLDVPSGLARETRVMRLSHAEAATIAPILLELIGPRAAGPANQTNRSPDTPSISLHEPSNALIISAEPEMVAELVQVASALDVRRKQVLVEAIIVEVSDTAAQELGLQFLVAGTDGNVPFASSTFSSAAPNLLALTGALADDTVGGAFGDGSTSLLQEAATASLLGLTGGTVGFGTERNGTLFSVVLNALEEDVQSNILSKPSILALNNETAEVSVGQDIPISSGQVLGDANANPFQTTQREQIGVILNVTPRIADDNTIQLNISQEVSSIASAIGGLTTDFILNQSSLNTSVIVDDGELVVLGGLIQAEDMVDRQQVPILGDIPFAGRLFRFEQESRTTSNLMVFIRPTIIADKAGAEDVTQRNYNYIRAQQIIANEGGRALIDDFVEQTLEGNLPDLPATQTDTGSP